MKNLFKLPLLALVITLSVAGCKGNNSGSSSDTSKDTSKVKMDSSSTMKSDSSVKVDTSKGSDTSKHKVDTVSKTVTKHVEVKKASASKN